MSKQAPGRPDLAVTLRTPEAVDQALRDPALRVVGRGAWHEDPRVNDLIDRMPSMHDDDVRRACLIPVRALLSPDAVQAAAPSMRLAMRELALSASRSGAQMDLVDAYTSLVAPTFLRTYLGLESAVSARDLRAFSASLTAELVKQGPPDQDRVEIILGVSERIRALVSSLRRRHSGDHPLDRVIAAVPDDRDVTAVVCLLASGGQETVSSLTCSVLLAICDEPAQAVRWLHNPLAVVDEMARLLPPIMMLARQAAVDIRIDGVTIQAGRTVLLDLTSASRGNAEGLAKPLGTGSAGLAFGMGIHRCLGRSVARAIVPIATDAILDALPHLRESTFRVSGSPVPGVFRGPTSMSVIHPTVDSGVWHPSDVAVEEREA